MEQPMTGGDTYSMVLCRESVKSADEEGGPVRPSTLQLVHDLCRALEIEGVDYCHWKSTAALDRSASGENDLDLLVNRADAQLFTEILYRLGFKEAYAPSAKRMPGILDFYGYDREADRLVHVHAHYQLILGDDMTKNYRLPIENPFLKSAVQGDLFRIPAPEFEFIVLVIRMVLKHGAWDAILSRCGTIPTTARQELEDLQGRVNQASLYRILQQHLPFIDAALFERCLWSLQPNSQIGTRIKVNRQLQHRLQAHARRAQTVDTGLKLWRRIKTLIAKRVLRRSSHKRLANGGVMIALVGGDGAGKSTALDELSAWLSKDFDICRVHMGKPAWSWTTIAVRGSLKIGLRMHLFPYTKSPTDYSPSANSPVFPGYLWLLREVCTARDRYLTYVKARRFATNGGIVICDRYPIPQIKNMDGPLVERMIGARQPNRALKLLTELEKRCYQQIMPPDLLIVLRINPEVAVQRKTNEAADAVRARCQEIWDMDWQQAAAHVIDAGRSRTEVLSELKSSIWLGL